MMEDENTATVLNLDGTSTLGQILCCECGVAMEPNSANMCVSCIRTHVDISEGITKSAQLPFCKFCDRYFQPPTAWISADWESKELLSVCLKKVKNLNRVRLVDACFVYTEPHSRRVKVKATVQKEVMNGAILQQSFVIEYTQISQMCDECRRVENKDYWRAVVQVRQKVPHKKTLYYMEQLILKHKAHLLTTGVKPMHGGIDFYFGRRDDAWRLVCFLRSVLPIKEGYAQELISHDAKSNIFDYKHTFGVEIVPICKNDVVCLSKKLAQTIGNIGQICVCLRISDSIHLIDPATGQLADVTSAMFWRYPFSAICLPRQLSEYTVVDIDTIGTHQLKVASGHGQLSNRHAVGDAWVVRSAELGKGDAGENNIRTHLGFILNPGDTALGLDISTANTNDRLLDTVDRSKTNDVVLVRKVYDRMLRHKRRQWKLKRLADFDETSVDHGDLTEFMEELEEDEVTRQNVNVYKDVSKIIAVEQSDNEDIPEISLQEMLEDLHLDDVEMADIETE